ncbi:MAG: family 78 glycoside hydrolase catalytic domain [Clostridiales bacterium]|nr:family 78 glycoside hydrolase catalytic domain [Clostridiales bacterium]
MDLKDVLPLKKAVIRNVNEYLREEKEMELEVYYEGDSFGRILWQPTVIFDFGRLVNGYIFLDVCGKAGTVVDINHSQTLQDGKVYPVTGGIFRYHRYVLKEGRQQIESFEYVNCRYVQFTVKEDEKQGFAGTVSLCGIRLRTTEYPAEQKGQFSCSDELLTRVWKSTEYTTRLCMNDTFMDNTFREKHCWGGDVSTIILSALTCFGNIDIIKRYLRMFIYEQSPSGVIPCIVPGGGNMGFSAGPMIDHGMAYPIRVRQYYEYTRDRELLNELYPGLRRYIELLERYETRDGILGELPGIIWFDWANLDRRFPSTILNFYYHIVLFSMVKIAEALGKDEDRAIFESKMENLKSYSDNFWDEERGVFPDCIVDGKFSKVISEGTNSLALLGNIADKEKKEAIIKNVFSQGFNIHSKTGIVKSGPPFSIYVLMGLCNAGYYNHAMDYIRERHGSAFTQGLDTMPEAWVYSSNGETSAAQATLAAAFILSTEILGIKPLEAGFKKVLIAPHPVDLTWAKGSFPSSFGIIDVEWQSNKDFFSIIVKLPKGIVGVIEMPFEGGSITVVNESNPGENNYKVNMVDDKYYVEISCGKYNVCLKKQGSTQLHAVPECQR